MPSDDELCELDESLVHARASLRSFEAQGQMALADTIRRKIDTMLDLRLIITHSHEPAA